MVREIGPFQQVLRKQPTSDRNFAIAGPERSVHLEMRRLIGFFGGLDEGDLVLGLHGPRFGQDCAAICVVSLRQIST